MGAFDIDELKREQIKLAKKIISKDEFEKIERIAGFGRAFIENKKIISTIVVLDVNTLKIVEKKYLVSDVNANRSP